MRIFNTLTLLLLIGLIITACKEETPSTQEAAAVDLTLLQGEWVIDTVKRGETIAPSLNGGIFNFVDDKTFIPGVNLQGTGIEIDQPINYELDGESIKIMGNEELVFDIKQLDAQKMVLISRIRGFDFSFNFTRKK